MSANPEELYAQREQRFKRHRRVAQAGPHSRHAADRSNFATRIKESRTNRPATIIRRVGRPPKRQRCASAGTSPHERRPGVRLSRRGQPPDDVAAWLADDAPTPVGGGRVHESRRGGRPSPTPTLHLDPRSFPACGLISKGLGRSRCHRCSGFQTATTSRSRQPSCLRPAAKKVLECSWRSRTRPRKRTG